MKYYESIDDISLYNWRKALEGDHRYCRVDIDKGTEKQDVEAWEKMYDEYLKEFGIGKDFQRIIDLKIELANAQLEFAVSGVIFLKNKIRELESEIKELIEAKGKASIDDCLIHVGKWLGYRLDPKVVTVREFYKSMEAFQKEADRMRSIANKNKKNG